MERRTKARARGRVAVAVAVGVAAAAAVGLGSAQAHRNDRQPVLGARSVPIITVDRLRFRDLDRNGTLTPYEDWRLTPRQRATDLLGRMNLQQKAGLLVHGTLPISGEGYPAAALEPLIATQHMSTFITRLAAAPDKLATANNSVQELAEQQPLGIPAVISSDPAMASPSPRGRPSRAWGRRRCPTRSGSAPREVPR